MGEIIQEKWLKEVACSAWRREENPKAVGWYPREATDRQLSSLLRCSGRATNNKWELKQERFPVDTRKKKIPYKYN